MDRIHALGGICIGEPYHGAAANPDHAMGMKPATDVGAFFLTWAAETALVETSNLNPRIKLLVVLRCFVHDAGCVLERVTKLRRTIPRESLAFAAKVSSASAKALLVGGK
eukprot:TRINITY_DN3339_c0_g6_i1.p1 TRINITY_DN3339_c0_g6~~TRINITY_DN3339_c0_g6_i1.p1  ORF type:complete len:110 (+),score=7.27 TRINITY_DN3339_c0_g6_i1:70-399(+)